MSEIIHHYGPKVHILNNPFLTSVLAKLCSPETEQPQINHFIELIYSSLIKTVINYHFPTLEVSLPTRMTQLHPGKLYSGSVLDQNQKVVIVNIARAGNFPSHICFEMLHYILKAQAIRQDYIFAARMTDDRDKVTGSSWSGMKIGGDIDNAFVILPDPMGATGNTIISAIDYYKNNIQGKAVKFIALHLIVTPEYLKKVTTEHPDAEIYCVRLDRGLSSEKVLKAAPGLYWNEERGLNEKDYIVPGGGGFGEIMNNSFV